MNTNLKNKSYIMLITIAAILASLSLNVKCEKSTTKSSYFRGANNAPKRALDQIEEKESSTPEEHELHLLYFCSVFGTLDSVCNELFENIADAETAGKDFVLMNGLEDLEGYDNTSDILAVANAEVEVCPMFGVLSPYCEQLVEELVEIEYFDQEQEQDAKQENGSNDDDSEQTLTKTTEFICSIFGSHPELQQCRDVIDTVAMVLAENLEAAHTLFVKQEEADDDVICCAAMTASCLSCSEGISEEEYCALYPTTDECPAAENISSPSTPTTGDDNE